MTTIKYHIRNSAGNLIYLAFECGNEHIDESDRGIDYWWATPAKLINGMYAPMRKVYLNALPHAVEVLPKPEFITCHVAKAVKS